MKKLLALLLALILVLSALVACSPDDQQGDDGTTDKGDLNELFPTDDGTDPAMPDVNWSSDLPLN